MSCSSSHVTFTRFSRLIYSTVSHTTHYLLGNELYTTHIAIYDIYSAIYIKQLGTDSIISGVLLQQRDRQLGDVAPGHPAFISILPSRLVRSTGSREEGISVESCDFRHRRFISCKGLWLFKIKGLQLFKKSLLIVGRVVYILVEILTQSRKGHFPSLVKNQPIKDYNSSFFKIMVGKFISTDQ